MKNFITKLRLGVIDFGSGKAELHSNGEYDFERCTKKERIQVSKRYLNSHVAYSRIGVRVSDQFELKRSFETNYPNKSAEPTLKTILKDIAS